MQVLGLQCYSRSRLKNSVLWHRPLSYLYFIQFLQGAKILVWSWPLPTSSSILYTICSVRHYTLDILICKSFAILYYLFFSHFFMITEHSSPQCLFVYFFVTYGCCHPCFNNRHTAQYQFKESIYIKILSNFVAYKLFIFSYCKTTLSFFSPFYTKLTKLWFT